MTYRYHGHHVGDINRDYYRSKEEERHWKENRDPITIFGDRLIKDGIATAGDLDAMREEVRREAEAAVEYALSASYPKESEVDMHVFTDVEHVRA